MKFSESSLDESSVFYRDRLIKTLILSPLRVTDCPILLLQLEQHFVSDEYYLDFRSDAQICMSDSI